VREGMTVENENGYATTGIQFIEGGGQLGVYLISEYFT